MYLFFRCNQTVLTWSNDECTCAAAVTTKKFQPAQVVEKKTSPSIDYRSRATERWGCEEGRRRRRCRAFKQRFRESDGVINVRTPVNVLLTRRIMSSVCDGHLTISSSSHIRQCICPWKSGLKWWILTFWITSTQNCVKEAWNTFSAIGHHIYTLLRLETKLTIIRDVAGAIWQKNILFLASYLHFAHLVLYCTPVWNCMSLYPTDSWSQTYNLCNWNNNIDEATSYVPLPNRLRDDSPPCLSSYFVVSCVFL